MALNTEYLNRCLETLERSYTLIKQTKENTIDYEMYRNSLVKSFEITLEQAGKLLKKRITPYFATKKEVDSLTFKDIFRYSAKFSLISEDEVKRWFAYRDNRNNTAHDYGRAFAEETLKLMDSFIKDTYNIKNVIENE